MFAIRTCCLKFLGVRATTVDVKGLEPLAAAAVSSSTPNWSNPRAGDMLVCCRLASSFNGEDR